MGSYSHLRLGDLEVDWGKNEIFVDYSALFQESDLKRREVPHAEDEDSWIWELFAKPLRLVIPRLALLGYTVDAIRTLIEDILMNYREFWPLDDDEDDAPALAALSASQLIDIICGIRVNSSSDDFKRNGEESILEFVSKRLAELFPEAKDLKIESFVEECVSQIGGGAILRLLGENSANLDKNVVWDFGEIVAEEYVDREEIVKSLAADRRFLLVTEGNTDALILSKALALRRPEIQDFFYFVDVREGYPFTGTGNLHNFCKGLIAIGLQNQTLIIYDNDAEGASKFSDTDRLNLPNNIRVMLLPDIEPNVQVMALGPDGLSRADINGRAASIECYVDLSRGPDAPVIRWTNYIQKSNKYQGSLINKEVYSKDFLSLTVAPTNYCFSNLDKCLDHIIGQCVTIAEARKALLNPPRAYHN